jgi:hypothetical protein
MADRPSVEVCAALNQAKWPQRFDVQIEPAPEAVLHETGQNWMKPLQALHTMTLAAEPDAILNLDDDQLFTPEGITEVRGHLNFFQYDRYEFKSLFFWDDTEHYNAGFPEHWSANLFRAYPHDAFATHFVAHCPEACARSKEVYRMQMPLRNYGYLTEDDRATAWARLKLAGKIDGHSCTLVRPPRLRKYEWQ